MNTLYLKVLVSFGRRSAAVLVALALVSLLIAAFLFAAFQETTETTGHLWWKGTREIPYAERRPFLIAAIVLSAIAASLVLATVGLWIARWRWAASPEGQAYRLAEETAQAAEEAARARWHWENSLAGRAYLAYQRGDHYFSIELIADSEMAEHLNDVARAGWVQESMSRRHERTTRQRPLDDGTHEATRETVEYRTYLFTRR